jgi:hypothetical protein
MVRERLDRRTATQRKYTAMRDFTYSGIDYSAGKDFPIDGLSLHQVLTLHGARHIDLVPVDQEEAHAAENDRGVTLKETSPGRYEITADWLDEPEKARGKTAAEKRAEELRAEGPPLGFIKGGSQLKLEETDGGWYAITGPWLETPVKVHGRSAAETRLAELHAEGEPETYGGYTLTGGEGGWYTISKPDHEGELKVQGEEAAREAVAQLRAGEQPADTAIPAEWMPEDTTTTGGTETDPADVNPTEGGEVNPDQTPVEQQTAGSTNEPTGAEPPANAGENNG